MKPPNKPCPPCYGTCRQGRDCPEAIPSSGMAMLGFLAILLLALICAIPFIVELVMKP